ncbi:hypothetical protein [Verrucosispora sioxanthis]|uniref:hypothetical protein n=1 Tax=Verrucosispora sioxanthis TaxID=2499994 RepID=UPI0028153D19|nr:hypothetical protein [Verrucosispora sioxanthis]
MGDQVGRHVEPVGDLAGRGVTEGERVHDRQACRLAERGMGTRPGNQRRKLNLHRLNYC